MKMDHKELGCNGVDWLRIGASGSKLLSAW